MMKDNYLSVAFRRDVKKHLSVPFRKAIFRGIIATDRRCFAQVVHSVSDRCFTHIHTYIYYSAHSLYIGGFQWLHGYVRADRGRLWAHKWRFKQPLLVHTSLMICPLAYVPNPPRQLSLWEETRVHGENLRLSAERWLFTLFAWGLGSSRIGEVLTEAWTCGLSGERQVR